MNIFRKVENLEWEVKNLKSDLDRENKEYWELYWKFEMLLKHLGLEAIKPDKPAPIEIRKIKLTEKEK